MKRLFLFFFIIIIPFTACKTLNTASTVQTKHDASAQQAPASPVQESLTERIWRLAGIHISGNFLGLDANMDTAKINFLKNGRFEATSGITAYSGIWIKGHQQDALHYTFFLNIYSEKIIDSSNTLGLPFDNAFMNNLKNTAFAEIDQTSVKFYSNDEELLLHFVRM